MLPTRQLVLLVVLLFALWLTEIRYPPLSYPHVGLLLLLVLVALTTLLPMQVRKFSAGNDKRARLYHPSLLPGFAFLVWLVVRWIAEDMQAVGSAEVGTALWTAAWFICAWSMSHLASIAARLGSKVPTLAWSLLVIISLVGLACGIHAVWQYHVAYLQSYRELLAAIGDRPPDRTELGLLYHLQLRRVASVWGDPNALATFSAMAICASLELLNFPEKWRALLRLTAVTSIAACIAAIFYTGSRGGALDAIAVMVVYAGQFLFRQRRKYSAVGGAAAIVIGLLTAMAAPDSVHAQVYEEMPPDTTTRETAVPEESGWVWRSNTIRERLYYLQVGAGMIKMAPLFGLGPGSVELYFGRLKPPEARETKYLHNWLVQAWAELGIVGVALLLWFVAALAWSICKHRLWLVPHYRAIAVLYFLLIFDGLIQISWSQRELMAAFGMICGILAAQTGTTAGSFAFPKQLQRRYWLFGAMAVSALLVIFEGPHLVGLSNKQLARDAIYAGDAESARNYWSRASRWQPRDPEPYAARASIALDQGRLTASRMYVEKALELQPSSAATHSLAAQIYDALHQPGMVDVHLTKALQLYPANAGYNYQYARHLQALGMLAEALQFAQAAVRYNPEKEADDIYQGLVTELQNQLKGNKSLK